MHKIYFEKRCLLICPPDEQVLTNPNAVLVNINEGSQVHDLINMFEVSDSLGLVYIPSEDTERTYRLICDEFKEVNAGGGLVRNRRGDYLLIKRNGLWDLPKGHQEDGEDIQVTALREVEEETGIPQLELGQLICVTDHCYRRNDIWHLKHTWWYEMLYCEPTDLTPQKEEDISKAAWVAKSSLPAFLTNTFPSLQEVLKEAKV